MGQTLKKSAKWTAASDVSGGKLEFTRQNELMLNIIIKQVESFQSENPQLINYIFKSPLTWVTALRPADLAGAGYDQIDDNVESSNKTKDGQSMVSLKKKSGQYHLSVYSYAMLDHVVKLAGENKLNEVRACLEANRDPVAIMLGDRFATVDGPDSSTVRFMEEVLNEEGEERDEKKATFDLLMVLKNFDYKLYFEVFKVGTIQLNPSAVDCDYGTLKCFCGNDEDSHALSHIEYLEPFTHIYQNGCRAPPFRQIHGELCYLEIKPHDGNIIYVTASKEGYFTNQGFDKDTSELKYDREGEYYASLIALIREKSSKFGNIIDKKPFELHEDKDGQMDITADLEQERDYEQTMNSEQQQQRAQQQQDDTKKGQQGKGKKQEKKKKLEPSIKWKNLGVDEEKKNEENKERESRKKRQKKKSYHGKQKPSDPDMDSDFEESSSESEEEEETPDRRNESNADLPSEYWQIQKLVKYLKGGNQTATIIALCSMRDFNLAQETCQLAIRDVGGLEVLINLLDTSEIKCKIGSLKILKEISRNTQIRRAIADLGGLQTMVKILGDRNKELKCLAAETIANVAKFRRARRTVRQHGGIKKLVALLDCAPLTSAMTCDMEKDVEVARCGALALWSCSKSTKNKQAMRKAGAIPLLAKLLKSPHENMLIPVVGTLQECASEPSYRLAIRTEGMIEDLVKNLQSENQELEMHCASAIFKCAEEKETRDLVRHYGGLDPLVSLLSQTENKELLAAATGAIWKCAISPENVIRFQELKAIDMLVSLLNDQPEEVLVNVVGALGECAKDPPNRMTIRKAGGIPPLVNLLTGTNQALLVNVTKAAGRCAEEPDNMVVIDKLDGVRLLWSLLKNQNPEVQASAAWAICPCIENAKDAGEMVRSFVGGLELIVSLLKSEDKEVLASVCAAIANIARDEENLAVITDHGVVPMLAKLTNTTDDKLRQHLAEAIARCCNWGNNRVAFGEAGAVAPLVKYLKSSDEAVHRSTAKSLFQLSRDPDNCIAMHDNAVVKPLMDMVGAKDGELQDAAAGCIANIRRLALANEKAKHKGH